MKQGLSPVPETDENNAKLLFFLSPNDLVYVPTEDEIKNGVTDLNVNQIFKIVSFTNKRLYALPYYVSRSIVDKIEYTQLNKIEFTLEKEVCVPIKVNRLGQITYLGIEHMPNSK